MWMGWKLRLHFVLSFICVFLCFSGSAWCPVLVAYCACGPSGGGLHWTLLMVLGVWSQTPVPPWTQRWFLGVGGWITGLRYKSLQASLRFPRSLWDSWSLLTLEIVSRCVWVTGYRLSVSTGLNEGSQWLQVTGHKLPVPTGCTDGSWVLASFWMQFSNPCSPQRWFPIVRGSLNHLPIFWLHLLFGGV